MQCHSLNNLLYNSKTPIFPINKCNYNKDEFYNNCFDCGRKNPELISINNGVFICEKCGLNHMLFPGGVSILIKNDIKSLSEKEILFLKYGGNKKLYEFIINQCPSLINLPRKYLYNSPFLSFYQNQLHQLVYENQNYIIPRKELFQNKLYDLQINPNFCINEVYNSITQNNFFNTNLKRYNTSNNNKLEAINGGNDFKTITNNGSKRMSFNKSIYKLDDDNNHNHLLTQRTNNTHANTISNSNTLTYVSEKTNGNINENKNINNQKNKTILNSNNIVYTKPKLPQTFNAVKNESKIEIKTCRFNSSTNFNKIIDNINFNDNSYNYNSKNSIENSKDKNSIISKIIVTPSKNNNNKLLNIRNNNMQQNIARKLKLNNNGNYYTINNNESDSKENNSSLMKSYKKTKSDNYRQNIIKKNHIYYSYNKNNNSNKSDEKQKIENKVEKIVVSERKIKEIIISKKKNKKIDNSDNIINNLNLNHFKCKTNILDNIQNSNIMEKFPFYNKNDNIEKINYRKNTYFIKKNINNDKIKAKKDEIRNESLNEKNIVNSKSYKGYKRHFYNYKIINVNKSLKEENKKKEKEIINKNNSLNENKKKIKIRYSNKDNINLNKTTSCNFFINKNKQDCEEMKKMYFQKKLNRNNIKDNDKEIKEKEQNKNIRENISKKENLSEYRRLIKRDNVEQFQIIPIRVQKRKIYERKEDKKKFIEYNKENIKEDRRSRIRKLLKKNLNNENINKSNGNILSNSAEIKINETFKNSIRNKYKKQRSMTKYNAK